LHGAVVSVLDRAPSLLVLLVGFLTGAALGILARIWMRFITTHPEFSWGGTLIIVVGFGVMFLGQAGVYLGRRSEVRPSGFVALRVLAIVALVPLAFGAGSVAVPVIVFAPLAIIRTGWNRWLRVSLGVLALLPGVFVAFTLFSDLSAIRATIGLGWFALIYGVLVWAVSFSFASRDDPRFIQRVRDPRRHEGAPSPVCI
jgi:type IV secretory pathway TrbD component